MITEEDVTRFAEIRRDMEDIVCKASVSSTGFTPLMRRATGEQCDYAPIFGDIIRMARMVVADIDYAMERAK